MPTKKTETTGADLEMPEFKVEQGRLEFCLLGTNPLIMNRMPEKARQGFLAGTVRKTAAEKASTIKHDPYGEFVGSAYRRRESEEGATSLIFPGSAFKRALADVAIDIPGLKKAQIGRFVTVDDYSVDIYGMPQMIMSIMRSADMARTPDMRTRCIVPQWACRIRVTYMRPLLNQNAVSSLVNSAGAWIGIGDGRPQKGKETRGTWRVCDASDPEFAALAEMPNAREAQDAALANPAPYDLDTQELYEWFQQEVRRRHDAPPATPRAAARRKAGNGHGEAVTSAQG